MQKKKSLLENCLVIFIWNKSAPKSVSSSILRKTTPVPQQPPHAGQGPRSVPESSHSPTPTGDGWASQPRTAASELLPCLSCSTRNRAAGQRPQQLSAELSQLAWVCPALINPNLTSGSLYKSRLTVAKTTTTIKPVKVWGWFVEGFFVVFLFF